MPNIRISKSAAFGLTFLVPLSGLFISMRNFRMPYAKNIFWMWCCFMGLVFIYNPIGESESDSIRYAEQFAKFRNIESFEEISSSFYDPTSNTVDVYNSLVTFLVSRVFIDPHILFLVYAFVFGFFYSRNLWLIFQQIKDPIGIPFIIVAVFWGLVCPIWNINGVRMWTALHVFSYGVIGYIVGGNKKQLFFCALSVLFHFSFMLPCSILIAYLLLPKGKRVLDVLFVVYVVTNIFNELDLAHVRGLLSGLNIDFLQNRIEGYTRENYAERVNEAKMAMSSYVGIFKNIRSWSVVLLAAICLKRIRLMETIDVVYRLFFAGLLFSSVANLAASVPSGGRFISVGLMILTPALLLCMYRNADAIFQKKCKFVAVLFIFPLLLEIRMGMMFYGVGLFFQNFVTAFVWENVVPFFK